MTVLFSIYDDKTSSIAKVDKSGGLVVSPIEYSTAFYVSVDVVSTSFEIVPTMVGKNFIITGLLIASDKTFGSSTTAETLTLYEANADDITINIRTLFKVDLLKNDRLVATGMGIAVSKSITIAAIATDVKVDLTIAGYYIDL